MPRPSILLLIVPFLTAIVASESPAFGPLDFPCWRGPLGSGASAEAPVTLVDSIGRAKKVWTNAEPIPVRGWTNRKQGGVTGGFTGPSVAGGRVFISWYTPSGEAEDKALSDAFNKDAKTAADVAAGKFKVDADDHFLAVDAKTGATLWKRVITGEGINYNHSAQGPLATPFATADRVYFFSTGGFLHCLEARTGETVWRAPLGQATEWLQAKRTELIAAGTMFSGFSQGGVFGHGPMLADGVVVASDNDYRLKAGQSGSCGLVGLDAATGRLLWGPLPKAATYAAAPLRWVHKGKTYIVSYSPERLVLVDPAAGKILWEVTDHHWTAGTIAIEAGGHLALHARIGTTDNDGRLRCYRFDLNGCQLAWELPSGGQRGKPPWGWGSLVITHGTVFGCFRGVASSTYGGVDLTSGKPVIEFNMDNRNDLHAAHGVVFNGDRMLARLNGQTWELVEDKAKSPISLMMYSQPIIAGGFMYTRGGDGHLHCYDLRR